MGCRRAATRCVRARRASILDSARKDGATIVCGGRPTSSVASRIQAGTVWINQHGAIHPMVPSGGIKGSGYGVEFGVEGLKTVTRPQVMSVKK